METETYHGKGSDSSAIHLSAPHHQTYYTSASSEPRKSRERDIKWWVLAWTNLKEKGAHLSTWTATVRNSAEAQRKHANADIASTYCCSGSLHKAISSGRIVRSLEWWRGKGRSSWRSGRAAPIFVRSRSSHGVAWWLSDRPRRSRRFHP